MSFSKQVDKTALLKCECREQANFANFNWFIRVICTFE